MGNLPFLKTVKSKNGITFVNRKIGDFQVNRKFSRPRFY